MNRKATEIRVNGIVQGVGFRPFVYRLAVQLDLAGYTTNTGAGVVILVAGKEESIEKLVCSLLNDAPPLARIISLDQQPSTLPENTTGFSILRSETGRQSITHISPDISTCRECFIDISDPDNRRYGYPFTNCTNCGPRYTIIKSLPYDRPRTTMNQFSMCPDCLAEYNNPADRRFHAQPNACPRCGPGLAWHDAKGNHIPVDAPLTIAATKLKSGAVIGIKGLGGFHLAADAFSTETVNTLRQRKSRPFKPLAVMVKDVASARKLCSLDQAGERQLTAMTNPVVLLRIKYGSVLAENLAPHIDELGIMLPYTPLHHLLFSHPGTPECLVMTSGNAAGEPLCKDNEESIARLGSFCDGFLMHNRGIYTRVDDSVVRIIGNKPRFLRRSRGYAPSSVRLKDEVPPLLAVGAELKNCFCLARGRDAFMSQHIGNLNNLATLEFFEQTIERLAVTLEIEPQIAVADLHPDYLCSKYADHLDYPVLKVQHHWAHAASVMAEHGLGESLAIILDGTGFGPDGTVWGGEVLQCTLKDYKRLGRLEPLPLPGGDMAARQPWRMGLAALSKAGLNDIEQYPHVAKIPMEKRQFICEMLKKNINSPPTSSCGRLFDAVSSILGICQINTYEGQAAMELEARASRSLGGHTLHSTGLFKKIEQFNQFRQTNDLLEISPAQCIRFITEKLADDPSAASDLALFFHVFLVSCFGNMIVYLSRQTGIKTIVISGGSAQNRILVEGFLDFFSTTHLKLYTNEQVPANDGGLALGQAAIGGAHVSCNSHAG